MCVVVVVAVVQWIMTIVQYFIKRNTILVRKGRVGKLTHSHQLPLGHCICFSVFLTEQCLLQLRKEILRPYPLFLYALREDVNETGKPDD